MNSQLTIYLCIFVVLFLLAGVVAFKSNQSTDGATSKAAVIEDKQEIQSTTDGNSSIEELSIKNPDDYILAKLSEFENHESGSNAELNDIALQNLATLEKMQSLPRDSSKPSIVQPKSEFEGPVVIRKEAPQSDDAERRQMIERLSSQTGLSIEEIEAMLDSKENE